MIDKFQTLEYNNFCCPICFYKFFHKIPDKNNPLLICIKCKVAYPIFYEQPFLIDIRKLLSLNDDELFIWLDAQNKFRYKPDEIPSLEFNNLISSQYLENQIILAIGISDNYELNNQDKNNEIIYFKSFISHVDKIKNSDKISTGITEFLPFDHEVFDLIILNGDNYKILDLRSSLRELNRVLQTDGKIIFTGNLSALNQTYYELLPRKFEINQSINVKNIIEDYLVNFYKFKKKIVCFKKYNDNYLINRRSRLDYISKKNLLASCAQSGFIIEEENGYLTFRKLNNLCTKELDFFNKKNTTVSIDTNLFLQLEKIVDKCISIYNIFARYGYFFKRLTRYIKNLPNKIKNLKKFSKLLYKTVFTPKPKIPPKQKTILMLTISQIDIDSRINKAAQSLAQSGYEVKIMTFHNLGDVFIKEENIFPGVTYLRVQWDDKYASAWKLYQHIYIQAANLCSFDFIHVNDLTTLFTGWILARMYGRPLIYDAHELWSDNIVWNGKKYVRMNLLKRFFAKKFEKTLLRHVDVFFTVSPSIVKEYEYKYGRKPLLLPNFPQKTLLEKKIGPSIRKLCNIPKNKFVTLYLGGIGPGRNIEKVIRAHHLLDENYVFVIRGPGVEIFNNEYKKLSLELNLSHRIFFLPPVARDEIIAATCGADCGIVMLENLCSNFYWFYPNKFFEYSLAGLPVAVSNFPDVTEHINKVGNGVTFDPSSPMSIAKAIKNLAENRQEAINMGKKGKESILLEYNWENAVQILINEYDKLRKQNAIS